MSKSPGMAVSLRWVGAWRVATGHLFNRSPVIDTRMMIICGLLALMIASAAIIGKLRSNARELNLALWGQWRRE